MEIVSSQMSPVSAEIKLLAWGSGISGRAEELGSTYGNLISDNRFCRWCEPDVEASEGTRTHVVTRCTSSVRKAY